MCLIHKFDCPVEDNLEHIVREMLWKPNEVSHTLQVQKSQMHVQVGQ
jgi:hypothetical protein